MLPETKNFPTELTVATSPEELKQHLDAYLRGLPPDARAKLERFNLRVITEALDTNESNSALESLLPRLKTIDSAIIMQTEYPPVPWIVPDLLPPGLTVLSGKPKVGKSWLALQLALSILTGGKMFGRDVEMGRVLYLALEDNERRLQDRMKKQGWPVNPGGVDFMLFDTFRDQIGALNSHGGKRLLKNVEIKKYRLVIVDTFSRSIQGEQLDVGEMTQAVGTLQQYALSKGIGLLFLDHMPKNTGDLTDPIQHIYGSVSKAAALDTVWGLYKERGKVGAKLAITGRDIKDETLKLTFDMCGCYWHCEGNALDFEMTIQRKAILETLEDLGRCQAVAIADATGQQINHVRERLAELSNARLVARIPKGNLVFYEKTKPESNESSTSNTSQA
ncbi:MAG: AAA family ATPase [Anaerolineales bacterium]|jgi:RecA-family ATPase